MPHLSDNRAKKASHNASIYVGVPDSDPEIVANQLQIVGIQENGTKVNLPQPVLTGSGGYPIYNGSPIRLSVNGACSLKVLGKHDSQKYYFANVLNGAPITTNDGTISYNSLTEAVADAGFAVGNRVYTASYRSQAECTTLGIDYPDGGGADYVVEDLGMPDGYGNHASGTKQLTLITGRSLKLLQWGWVPNDLTPTNNSTRAAVEYLNSLGGGELLIPSGIFWFEGNNSIALGVGNITVRGEGNDVSILHFDEGTTAPPQSADNFIFRDIDNIAKGSLTFKDFQFRGTLNNTDRAGRWSHPVWLDYYTDVAVDNVKFLNIAGVGMDFHFLDSFSITNCHLENIAADGVRCRDTPNILVDNNFILRNGDDAIACHTTDLVDDARDNLIVTNNILINAGSIKNIAARSMTVANNLQILPNFVGIWVFAGAGPEGGTQLRDINVHDNSILNPISIDASGLPETTAGGIILAGLDARGSASTNGVAPTGYDSVSGDFIYPWDHQDGFEQDAADAIAPMAGINVHSNVIRRTLPSVAAFSDYGYGTRLFQGVGYDPAMDDTALRYNDGVKLEGAIQASSIRTNTIMHCKTAVNLSQLIDNDGFVYEIVISDNITSDITNRAFIMQGSSNYDVTLRNNNFDGDKYRKQSNSNTDGTYSSSGVPTAIDTGSSKGVKLIGNRFKNFNTLLATNVEADVYVDSNIVSCDPSSTGFSVLNKGVGTVIYAGIGWRYEIVDSDPTSPTYQQLQSTQLTSYQFNPTTLGHKWVEGAFVESSNPNVTADGTRLGWKRLTTGLGDVIDTDWTIVRVVGSTS
ncbi:MAG: phage tailspike protein [Oleispira sp.]